MRPAPIIAFAGLISAVASRSGECVLPDGSLDRCVIVEA
jgi:hypothetical protein